MQVTETLSEGLKRGFTIVVPAADIEQRRTARLTDLGRTLRLPGFRPEGCRCRWCASATAPRSPPRCWRNRSTGRRSRCSASAVCAQRCSPSRLVSQDIGVGKAADLEFKVELELLPEITLPDFAAVALTRFKAEVADETVEKALAEIGTRNRDLRGHRARGSGDRGAAKGEVLVVDYIGRIEGEEFPGGSANDVPIDVGGDGFIPGFTDQIEGLKPGDTRVIDVTFPDPYMAPNLAGKPAKFEIAAKKIQRVVPTPVDDALAQKLGVESMDELRRTISRRIQSEYTSSRGCG